MMSDAMYTTEAHADDNRNGYAISAIQIENYRIFDEFDVPRLGRVNLIAGKNNVGKSCLLEALQVYASRGAPSVLIEIMQERNEYLARRQGSLKDAADSIRNLFHGRKNLVDRPKPIRIREPRGNNHRLELAVHLYYTDDRDMEGETNLRRIAENQTSLLQDAPAGPIPTLTRTFNGHTQQVIRLERLYRYSDQFFEPSPRDSIPCVSVATRGLTRSRIVEFWDQVTLRPLEESEILRALRIISPKVEAVNIVGRGSVTPQQSVMVRLQGDAEPIPLQSLGEGMTRLFGLALAVVNARNGILVIDEIESGLHYSVQLEVWQLLLDIAERLNVQVFATTHSNDCIDAFQQTLNEREGSDGLYIRIERKGEKLYPVLFDAPELAIASRQAIEIR